MVYSLSILYNQPFKNDGESNPILHSPEAKLEIEIQYQKW